MDEPRDSEAAPLGRTESSKSIASVAKRASSQVIAGIQSVGKSGFSGVTATVSGIQSVGKSTVSAGAAAVKAPFNVVKADKVAKSLCRALGGCNATATSTGSVEADPEQLMWEHFSKWLQGHKLKNLELPTELPIKEGEAPSAPAWGIDGCTSLQRVSVLKRFNSRKLPHLIEFENTEGQKMKMIYKQEDDISMDVSVMRLFEMCNEVWARRGMAARLRTYKVVACPDLTGFGEIVPGDTMLHTTTEDMIAVLGEGKPAYLKMLHSIIGVIVSTAIFDITDRHHNNVLFTPDGELALIDLSASLGKEAPMDKALRINPIYVPERLKNIHEHVNNTLLEKWGEDPDKDMRRWSDLEEAIMMHYFAIYNDRAIEYVLDKAKYKALKPHKFLTLLHERKSGRQVSEGLRNNIVTAMDENDTINALVAGITRVVPMN